MNLNLHTVLNFLKGYTGLTKSLNTNIVGEFHPNLTLLCYE